MQGASQRRNNRKPKTPSKVLKGTVGTPGSFKGTTVQSLKKTYDTKEIQTDCHGLLTMTANSNAQNSSFPVPVRQPSMLSQDQALMNFIVGNSSQVRS